MTPMTAPRIRPFLDDAGRIRQWPVKRGKQLALLGWLATTFERDRRYTEKEVNAHLNAYHTFGDWALLRRELCDLRLLAREADGSAYWRVDPPAESSAA